MGKTYNFVANNVGDPEPVIVQSVCQWVWIREKPVNGQFSQHYEVREPDKTDDAVGRLAGEPHIFRVRKTHTQSFFTIGEVVGHISTASGAVTFDQEEGFNEGAP